MVIYNQIYLSINTKLQKAFFTASTDFHMWKKFQASLCKS